MQPRVLVVDDDEAILTSLRRGLVSEGFAVATASSGSGALDAMEPDAPDVVVLDVVLPDLDGVEVTERLRARGLDVPICILSARGEVDARVAGLAAGADDYVVKPFELSELVARLHALLRRRPASVAIPVRVGDLEVDPRRRLARRGDRNLDLTRREFDLLYALTRNTGIVLSRTQLLEDVWGYDFEVDGNVVDVFVGYLRRKLEAGGEGRLVQTVRGVGFVLRAES